jgi:putative flippase GtrA
MLKRIYNQNKETILYLFFGGLTTLVNIVSFKLMLLFAGVIVSNVVAWFVSVAFAYITNKLYVFNSKSFDRALLLKEVSSFFGYRVLSLIIDTAIVWFFVEKLLYNDLLIKILSNILVIILNYVFSKLFIFKKTSDKH